MSLKISFSTHMGLKHQVACDGDHHEGRGDRFTMMGEDYMRFRKELGRQGWIRRHGKWFGPCCTKTQLSLDLARTEEARRRSRG